MNGTEGDVNARANPRGVRYLLRRRFILPALLLAPLLLIALWECGHYARYGDFFTLGYHVDVVLDRSDIGAAKIRTFHCLKVTNYSFHTLQFEAIQLPPGITDGQSLYHNRVEKWNEQSHSWVAVYDSADDPSWRRPNTTKRVSFGQSIYPTSCTAVTGLKGIEEQDVVRLVAFTSYSKTLGTNGQLAFYSPPFTAQEEIDKHKNSYLDDRALARKKG